MNLITLTFAECEPNPSKGYRVQWRVLGSGDPYTDEGNFFSSPAVFTDDTNPPGTLYEGLITAQGSNLICNDVPWGVEESGEIESGESGFDNSSCGTTISQITASTTYVDLGLFDIHVDTASHVDLAWQTHDRPNRFTLYDNGVFADTTGWKGIAPYAGPWGMSLSTAESGTLGFDPIAGHEYKIRVEVGPAGPPPYDVSDNFDLDIICTYG